MKTVDIEASPNIKLIDHTWWHYSAQEAISALEAPDAPDNPTSHILDPFKTPEEQLAYFNECQKNLRAAAPQIDPEDLAQVDITAISVPGLTPEEPEVLVKIITPKKLPRGKRPAFIHFFGGGMIAGHMDMDLPNICRGAIRLKAIGIAVDYRLLPKYRYPAAVNDAEAAVNYLLAHADELRIDLDRMIVVGQSAGAYMAACIMHRMQARGDYQFAGQLLLYPVIDDYMIYPSSKLYCKGNWNPFHEQIVFEALLGPNYNRSSAPADAVPAHCTDFTGVPPTCLMIGDLDHARDPVLRYAYNIMKTGTYCDLHVVGGAGHGYLCIPLGTALSDRAKQHALECMEDLMSGKLGRK